MALAPTTLAPLLGWLLLIPLSGATPMTVGSIKSCWLLLMRVTMFYALISGGVLLSCFLMLGASSLLLTRYARTGKGWAGTPGLRTVLWTAWLLALVVVSLSAVVFYAITVWFVRLHILTCLE